MIETFKLFAIFKNLLMFVVFSSRSMHWRLFDQFLQKNRMCRNVYFECSQKQFDVNTMNTRQKKIINQFYTFQFYMNSEKVFRFDQIFVQFHFFWRDILHQRLADFTSIFRLICVSHVSSFFQKELDENFVRKNDVLSFVYRQFDVHRLRSFNLSRNRRFFCFSTTTSSRFE